MTLEAKTSTYRPDAPETLPMHEKPLKGAVYVCIGASRPDKSIGGPSAVALAQAGADVFITGADPSKEKKAERVLSDVAEAGSEHSSRGTFDVSTQEGIQRLILEVEQRYGQVDGVLYYPAGGLVGDDEEAREAHGRSLNEIAPVLLAHEFLQKGLIKPGGIFQMTPSVYSWAYPTILSPDPRYHPVAKSKHSGEMAMHAMTPEFQKAGVSLVFTVGHAVDGTFAARFLTKDLDDETRAAMLATADVDGEHKAPTIDDMAQATVDIATKARKGTLGPVHTEYVGVAKEAQIPLEVEDWDQYDTGYRLMIYGTDAQLVDDAVLYGNGRRVIARFHAQGWAVRQVLEGNLALTETKGTYEIAEADVKGHFDSQSGLPSIFQGIKNVALARTVSDTLRGSNDNVARISNVMFKAPSGPGMELTVEPTVSADDGNHVGVVISRNDKLVSSCEIDYSSEAPALNENTVAPEYFIESAAQSLLLAMQKQRGLDDMETELPLFGGIRQVDIYQHIERGENVTIDAYSDSTDGSFSGNAIIYKADGSIAQVISGITGGIMERERISRYLQKALSR